MAERRKNCYKYIKKTEVYLSQSYIAEKLHYSIRTISRVVKELKEKQFIKTRKRGSSSSVYILLCKKIGNNNINKAVNKAKKHIRSIKILKKILSHQTILMLIEGKAQTNTFICG
ncbi:hypothetical protein NL50_02690 [Clostridium acetobutylicum]|nr:hypothetical protein NL50_02690 [Clostridium acetobutylicum]